MSKCISEFKFSKTELAILDKFSKINDKLFISPDKIQVIDGVLKGTSDGAANNRFNGGNRSAIYKFENPHNFIDELGIANLPTLISTVKSFGDDHMIEVYDRYLMVSDKMSKLKFYLTPPEANVIPTTDVETMVNRAGQAPKKVEFKLEWNQLNRIFEMQKITGSFNIHFFIDQDGEFNVKIGESFEENGNNIALMKIDKENIIEENLEAIRFIDGKQNYNKFELLRNDFVVMDNYHFILVEKGLMMTAESLDINYVVKASVI